MAWPDSPLPAPENHQLWSAHKRAVAEVDVHKFRTTVFRLGTHGRRTKLYVVPASLSEGAVTDDGLYLVSLYAGGNLVPAEEPLKTVLVRVYKHGVSLHEMRLSQLYSHENSLRRTVSHYAWGQFLGLKANRYYEVQRLDGSVLDYDIKTGKLNNQRP